MANKLQLRRGNLSAWTSNNPTLANGEFVLVSTNNNSIYNAYKIGNGVDAFNSLPLREYTGVLGYGSPQGVYATSAALVAANPNKMYIYLVQADGNWYYWNTTTSLWTAGGLYQTPLSVVSDYGTSDVSVINQNKLSTDFQRFSPTLRYGSRVLADSGTIFDLNKLTELYIKNLQLLDSTVFLWSGVAGMKTRTSGSNVFASKLYNMANKVQQFGSELVTNGTFTTNTSGWTANSGADLSVDTARLKVTNTAGTNGGATQAITTVVGKTYHLNYAFTLGAGNGQVRVGTTLGGSQLLLSPVLSANATRTVSFVATGTTTYLFFGCDSLVSTDFAIYDTISVKQMDWVDGTNDAVQTTEANQPYVGGLIAPNEVMKMIGVVDNKAMKHNKIWLGCMGGEGFAITTVLNPTYANVGSSPNKGDYAGGESSDSLSLLLDQNGRITLYNTQTSSILWTLPSSVRYQSKNIIVTITATSGGIRCYANGELCTLYFGTFTPNMFNLVGLYNLSTNDSFAGSITHHQIFNRALSASEIQAQHEYLRLQIPEIEGVAIGNQYWPTSNYEGVVAGDGSVIPEVQNSDNVEKITDVRDREFSEDTGWWTKSANTLINDSLYPGVLHYQKTGTAIDNIIRRNGICVAEKSYRVRFTIKNYVSGSCKIRYPFNSPTFFSANGTYEVYGKATGSGADTDFSIQSSNLDANFDVDDLSIEEVGWSQSTTLYDAIYAQTSGTTAQKELAALKAAAMWCYPNNSVDEGAVRGKELNSYAIRLLDKYPPVGYRVPREADVDQLIAVNGGLSAAGPKLKALFGVFNNAFSTNETGFSAIPTGRRDNLGDWGDDSTSYISAMANNGADIVIYAIFNSNLNISKLTGGVYNIFGVHLRLLRNSPVGPNETTVTTGTIVNALGAGNLDIVIPFGYAVDSIKVISKTGITGLSAKYCSRNPSTLAVTELDTLFTAKTVVADTPKLFNCNVDQTIQRQDAVVRINGTKADTAAEFEVRVNIKKAIL